MRKLPVLGPPLIAVVQRLAVEWMLGGCVVRDVALLSVSDLIAAHGLTRVDLLKIDVERGEWGVLGSVEPHHWRLIRCGADRCDWPCSDDRRYAFVTRVV